MQSSLVEERLAGNYKALSEAHMAAEAGASSSLSLLSFNDIPDSEEECADISAGEVDIVDVSWREDVFKKSYDSGYSVVSDVVRCNYDGEGRVLSRGYVIADGSSDILSERYLVFSYPEGGGGLDAVFTCIGFGCEESRVDADNALDGDDHPVAGQSFNCSGQSCRYPSDDGLDSVPEFAGFLPDRDGYEDRRKAWEELVKNLPAPVASYGGKKNNKMGSHGSRSNPVVIEITGGVKINGSVDTAGIIIVRDGGYINKANGTAHHEGLIIVEEGGEFDIANGTFNLYGGIVKLKPEDSHGHGGGYDLRAGGNAGLNYSSEAVMNLNKIADIDKLFESSGSSGDGIDTWDEL